MPPSMPCIIFCISARRLGWASGPEVGPPVEAEVVDALLVADAEDDLEDEDVVGPLSVDPADAEVAVPPVDVFLPFFSAPISVDILLFPFLIGPPPDAWD